MNTQNNKFISFDNEAKKVTLALTFDVVESDVKFKRKELKTSIARSMCITALKARMCHCQNVLTNEILPNSDKVFTSSMIFSNTVQKHFSIVAFETMEEMEKKFCTSINILETLMGLNDTELCQLLKAMVDVKPANTDEEETKEYLVGLLVEMIIMKGRNLHKRSNVNKSPLFNHKKINKMDLKEKIMLENEKAKYKTLLGILSDEEFKALALKFYKIAIKM